ncbi:hypothetical protein B0H67DRAFT_356281 [Lasiosphaeris hirsuta]|uniref:RGS domain-containing protein n=1 Tax=Lasiosphaeris hirsuta TaxID=260670 RepID=A0AA40DLZ7_9PEZI|nr:hypothetical protein B0H67DRAFT_356281 [Lasiosphaeris hirsuta]
MADFETANQLGEAVASPANIPTELSFEEVIKNRTAPPCSLNDFMDYLFYVEHNAESLQFFLWYYDYVQRWSGLLPRQKALSPVWEPENASEPRSRFITYSHKRARSQKMNKIISIMEMESERNPEDPFRDQESRASISSSASSIISRPRTPPSAVLSPTESTKGDWQPFTIQPFRDEISRVVRQYIAESAPRQLNLAPKDRDNCLRAAQYTTHPSALLSAFLVAEANLRSHSHPKFIRWTASNGNRARIVFLRIVGMLLVLLGIGLDAFLILSRQSHFLRIACLVLWWPGFTVLIAAYKSLCIVLHFNGARQLRPWELANDLEQQDTDDSSPSFTPTEKDRDGKHSYRHHCRKDTQSSLSSRGADPLRKTSLQTFGPKNDYSREQWFALYRQKSLAQRIFGETAPVQNAALRLLQDRTVFYAVLCGGLLASGLTVASLFAPSGMFFL